MKFRSPCNLLAVTAAVIATLAFALPGSAQQRRAGGRVDAGTGSCIGGTGTLFDQIEPTFLTAAEEAELVYLREEEKLARDVYLTLAGTWQLPIFRSIAGAEQRHMDSVKRVLDLYGMADPVADDSVGMFTNPTLAQLYKDLVDRGNSSLVEALTAGATIEDLDLADLEEMLAMASNDHVKLVGYNLAKGSRNHLRAFMAALEAQDGTYQPQYLDQESFDAILASDMERRIVYNQNGEPIAVGSTGIRGGQGRRGQGQGYGARQGNGAGQGTGGPGNGTCTGQGPGGGA
jgi:hypothetical protein